jgi:hypothetical protein
VGEKAKAYLAKKRKECEDEIRRRLGPDEIVYNTIQVRSKKNSLAKELLGGSVGYTENLTGLVEIGDGRIMSGGLKIDLSEMKVTCVSFDQDWRCLACSHPSNRPVFGKWGCADLPSIPQAIILADQSVPAILPVKSAQQCIKIFILEHGSLLSLWAELEKLIGNRRVPKGSCILVFSASHLAAVGIAGYTEEFLVVKMMIKERLGKATIVLPLPPILLGGSDRPDLLREVCELMSWTEDYFKEDGSLLDASLKAAREILMEQGTGSKETREFRRVLLPDMYTVSKRKPWSSGGMNSIPIPTVARAMTASQEKKWVSTLIEELREKLALDLDPSPTLERGMGLQSKAKRKGDFLVVGSSNAARLARALTQAGYIVAKMLSSNWRITKESCELLAVDIAKVIQQDDPGAVVLHMLDASYFHTKGPDGSRTLPKKLDDGKYHICGDLVLCGAETQADHLQALRPILDAIGGRRPCLIVSPMPRYVIGGCCMDVRHVANRLERNFRSEMQWQLDGATKRIKNFLFHSNRRNMRVLDSCFDTRDLPNEDIWFVDPVHPIDPVYRLIASGVIKMAATLKNNDEKQDAKRRRADSWDMPQKQKSREGEYSRNDEREEHSGRPHEAGGRPRGRGGQHRGRGNRGGAHGGHRY